MNIRAWWDGNWPKAICVYAYAMERGWRGGGGATRQRERKRENMGKIEETGEGRGKGTQTG